MEILKLAAAAIMWKRFQAQNPYMPLIQDKLNQRGIAGLDKLLGRHEMKQVGAPNKYDGIRSKLKSIFNSLPGGK